MSRFVFLAAAMAALTLAAPAFAQARYFAELEDLPMPPGFVQTGAARMFETPQGALILIEAEGQAPLLEVRDFYYEALPALGWSVSPRDDGVLMFQRGRERLTFTLEREGAIARLGVRAAILPAPAGD